MSTAVDGALRSAMVPLAELAHIETRIRTTGNLHQIYERMRRGAPLPPIVLSIDRRNLIDGNHRLTAARLLAHTEIAATFCDPPVYGPAKLRQQACVAARCSDADVDAMAVRAVCQAQAFLDGNRDVGSTRFRLQPIMRSADYAESVVLPTFADQQDNDAAADLVRRGFVPNKIIPLGLRLLVHFSEHGAP